MIRIFNNYTWSLKMTNEAKTHVADFLNIKKKNILKVFKWGVYSFAANISLLVMYQPIVLSCCIGRRNRFLIFLFFYFFVSLSLLSLLLSFVPIFKVVWTTLFELHFNECNTLPLSNCIRKWMSRPSNYRPNMEKVRLWRLL